MPAPDIVFEFEFPPGLPCPGYNQLRDLQNIVAAAIPLGRTTRALAICSGRSDFSGNVLSIGLWIDDEGESEEQLKNALIVAGPLVPQRTVALLFGANAIQYLASAGWSDAPKRFNAKIGFVRLSDEISVEILGHLVVTTVTGQYKLRFLPNIPFTLKVRDRLSGLPPGSVPPLIAKPTTSLSVNTIAYALLAALISPALARSSSGRATTWLRVRSRRLMSQAPAAG
jgi:hypothetical protein